MFINSISASKSDIIDQCLWKYNLRYNLKIPGFGSKNEDALSFGSFIHKIFELGFQKSDLKTLSKLAEQERSTYKVQFQMNEKIKSCIEHFISWNSKLGETVATETAFELPLDKEHDINFKGVIDRIVKGAKGGYLVIDYKTSKREKTKKELLEDKQLMGYAYAINQLYGTEYKDIWCGHFYPVTGHFITVQFSKFQITQWKKKEIDKVWRIRKKTSNDFPAHQNMFCGNCEYQKVCEHFCSKEEVAKNLEEQIKLRDQLKAEKEAKEASNSVANQDESNKNSIAS